MGTPNNVTSENPLKGGCACSHVRYTLSSSPLIVHACHCTYCQRETGSSFALNALYEPDRVHTTLSTGEKGDQAERRLLRKGVPTANSGAEGQVMVRCPECFTVVWSHYSGNPARRMLKIVRVGTIDGIEDDKGRYAPSGGLRPHAHIFAGRDNQSSKRHTWFEIPEKDIVFKEYGPVEDYWPKESLDRYKAFSEAVSSPTSGIST